MTPPPIIEPKKENLKQRAYLNSLTSIIDFTVTQLTGFIISPFIVNGLGSAMYGAWQMLNQMTGYAEIADTRATQVLKWTIAKKKDVVAEDELRSDVSSALAITMFIVPLVLVAGGVMAWYAPSIITVDEKYHTIIRVAGSLLIFSLVITKVFDLYESVLRGMNLSFKLMGLRAAVVIIGGALKVLVLAMGYGLVGLALVQIALSFITGLTFYLIVRRAVNWFGFGATDFGKIKNFSKVSGWYLADNGAYLLLSNSDKILLGYLAGPTVVTFYTLTLFLPAAMQGMINRLVLGVIPGIGKLIGLQEYEKITKIKRSIDDITYLLITAAGVTIIILNKSFLAAWVGDDMFAGDIANILIILMVMQDIFLKNDSYIVNATLDLKEKVGLTLLSGVCFITIGYFAVGRLEIEGLCISLLAGKTIVQIGQQQILKKKIKLGFSPLAKRAKPLLVSLLLFAAAGYLARSITILGLVQIIGLAPFIFLIVVVLYWFVGIRKESRRKLVALVSSIKFFKSD